MNTAELSRFFHCAAQYPAPFQARRNSMLSEGGYHDAAVLLAVVRRESQWQILLTRRADTLRRHTGQIALAGGRCDDTDDSPTVTALRETDEETGIAPQYWQTFPQLPPYYTPSGYSVFPIPAICSDNPKTQPNTEEVAEIFYLPLDFALNRENYSTRTFQYSHQSLEVPVLPYLHYDIWGLTAMILYDMAERYHLHLKAV
ncbi:NUDIX hydrolase [Neisseria arctica]|uniref:NUDIX hydrolase n=1 Tax=Neisseria arctica TaxID=1470200 RepID=A0A0J0YTS9_9NEIS|nr:CoA pyrophosphatase [Neisseria arctica]KLT73532.1 NUDIX hydrolase [Neisseria arctica]UOO86199.1 CoA pyrophosphatase [Neisseria arctica]